MSAVFRTITLLLFLSVYIIGLIGNGLLIFIVFRQKNLRTVPNLLVVSLALGDFLFVLFCVPFGAVAYSLEYYPFSTFYCRFENFIINLSLGVSVFSLLALSADRYKIIVKPFSSHANDPSIKLKTIVISIWVLSTILALPETIYSGLITETFQQENNQTVELIYCWSPNESDLLANHIFMISRQILRVVIYYIMPLIFVSVFYILIAKHLFQTKHMIVTQTTTRPLLNDLTKTKRCVPSGRLSKPTYNGGIQEQQRHSEINNNYKKKTTSRSLQLDNDDLKSTQNSSSSSSAVTSNIRRARDLSLGNSTINNNMILHTLYQDVKSRKQLRARHKVAKTVLFLCTVFFICWLPKQIHDLYWFIGVIVYSARWNHFWQFNKTLALIFSYTYSCINPFALYFLSSTFRHFYKRYLCFWTNSPCCSTKCRLDDIHQRRRTGDMGTVSEYQHRSSANNVTGIYYDLNRTRNSTLYPTQQSPIRMHRYTLSDGISSESGYHQTDINHQRSSSPN
ncbi:unnamed protein product [Adineta ricciae]|uniref:G-protein coupled receptors family 1 profile domain-containing protein n=1 Tax=Adineta ricciae TaxID=249248 RepID=A0A814C0T7_ADIRI|nr:unnamed protein product [Adineta ricciae]CAF0936139.1 unnamed protein product [Adineta ricciae]